MDQKTRAHMRKQRRLGLATSRQQKRAYKARTNKGAH